MLFIEALKVEINVGKTALRCQQPHDENAQGNQHGFDWRADLEFEPALKRIGKAHSSGDRPQDYPDLCRRQAEGFDINLLRKLSVCCLAPQATDHQTRVSKIGQPEENTRGVNFPFFYGENGEFLPGIPNHFFLVIVRLFLRYFLHFLLATV